MLEKGLTRVQSDCDKHLLFWDFPPARTIDRPHTTPSPNSAHCPYDRPFPYIPSIYIYIISLYHFRAFPHIFFILSLVDWFFYLCHGNIA
mmetsp:Transcript_9417/g.34973  ORF Transcript_9417/g.34973 Transcript_9417/m.34973 type:complete len:90 (-) Transcript_9417:4322-4591(-)